MSEDYQDEYPDILTSHNYDGIQEFDNPMPFWWKALFVVTVIWGFLYMFAMEFGLINTYEKDLLAEQQAISAIRLVNEKAAPTIDDAMLTAAAGNPDTVSQGQKVFGSTCASCHGDVGQGMIGPNLTDDSWIHGGTAMEIHTVVTNGVASKGMPAWGQVLSPDDAVAVVAFIRSIAGSNPPNAKAPQGEKVAQ